MQIREISSISKEEGGPGPSLFAHYAHSLATPTRTKHSKVAMAAAEVAGAIEARARDRGAPPSLGT